MLSSGVFDNFRLLGFSHIQAACQEAPLPRSSSRPRGYHSPLVYPKRSRGTSRLSRPSRGHAHLTPSPLESPLVGCSIRVHFKGLTGKLKTLYSQHLRKKLWSPPCKTDSFYPRAALHRFSSTLLDTNSTNS